MSTRVHYIRLGVFIILAVALTISIALILGGGNLFKSRLMIETYFDETIQGLMVGSKIKYRGVTVGEVTNIGFTYARYEQDKPPMQRKQYVLVEGVIDPVLLFGQKTAPTDDRIDYWIGRGLRFRLNPQGITGTSYVELDFFDNKGNPPLPKEWEPENMYIPSATSTLSKLVNTTENFFKTLDKIDLPVLLDNINRLLTNVNDRVEKVQATELNRKAVATLDELQGAANRIKILVGSDRLDSIPENLNASSARLRKILEDTDLKPALGQVDGAMQQIDGILKQLDGSVKRLDTVLLGLDKTIDGKDFAITSTLENLRHISENLREVSEEARRYPAGTILGEPPRPATVFQPEKGRK